MLFQFFVNGLISGSIYALIAIGFSIIYGTVRFFHFAHAGIYTSGAYAMYTFFIIFKMPFVVSFIFSCIFTGFLGVIIEFLIYKPMRKKGSNQLTLLTASIGIFICLQNFISLLFGDDVKTIRLGFVNEGYNLLGARITAVQISIILVSLILFSLVFFIMRKTRVGKSLTAIATNPELAIIKGIEIQSITYYTFFIGSALAAIASILISLDIDMTPVMGFNALLYGVVAVIIGGYGNIIGSYFGGIILGFIQQIGIWQLSTKWQDPIVFAVLIFFLLFYPKGIFQQYK